MATFTTMKKSELEKHKPNLVERLQDLALEERVRSGGHKDNEHYQWAEDLEELIARYQRLQQKRHNQRKANRGVNRALEAALFREGKHIGKILDKVYEHSTAHMTIVRAWDSIRERGDAGGAIAILSAYLDSYLEPSSSSEPES